MKKTEDCFLKVKNDYLSFLSKEKIFDRSKAVKLKSLKKTYIPMSFWIENKYKKKRKTLFLILFGLSNLVLFGGIYWSKFAHMFYKPGAAIQKRLAEADGSNENLPYPTDKPKQFGLGIKREAPKHY